MTARPSFTARQVARMRMQSLGLAAGAPVADDVTGVVVHHLAMQGQDFPASRWAIGSRLEGAREADVLGAFDSGAIVRSWPMRGTVHVVAADDLPWMLEHLGERALSGVKRRWENLGIDERFLERGREVALALLTGGERVTRAELVEACEGAGLEMNGQRSYHMVWYLSQTGTLVQGPTRGDEPELVLLSEWIPSPRRLDREAALAELGVRYLRARGPATVDDLVHWTKLPKGDARRAFDAGGDGTVVEVEGPGGPHFMLAEHLDTLDPDRRAVDREVHALAAFDEHLLGYRVRDAVLDPAHATRVDPGRNGVFRWTLVAGGRVVGTWKRVRRARYVIADIESFEPISTAVRSRATKAVARWGRFVGVDDVRLRWADADEPE